VIGLGCELQLSKRSDPCRPSLSLAVAHTTSLLGGRCGSERFGVDGMNEEKESRLSIDTYLIPWQAPAETLRKIWANISRSDNGCWEWTGPLTPYGYAGPISVGGRPCRVHRLTYSWFKGDIPDGYVVDHLCENKRCVNPDHLEAVTPGENSRRANTGRRKTHCSRGHAYTPENRKIYVSSTGKPVEVCLPCIPIRNRETRQNVKARLEKFMRERDS